MSDLTTTKKVSRAELELAVINLISDINNDIECLNEGGCGYFAYFVHKELKECGIKAKMLILDNDTIFYKKEILNDIINNGNDDLYQEGYRTSFNHCCIQVDDITFDGENLNAVEVWKECHCHLRGHYTRLEMETALRYGSWNNTYNKSQNEKLLELIKRNFEHLKN